MKLTKVKIEQFKSIIDSKEFSIESDYIVLAGKNESGKTTVLKAIEYLNGNNNFKDNDMPISITRNNWTPCIKGSYKFSEDEIKNISNKFEFKIASVPKEIEVCKKKDGLIFELSEFKNLWQERVESILNEFLNKNQMSQKTIEINVDDLEFTFNTIEEAIKEIMENPIPLMDYQDAPANEKTLQEKFKECKETIFKLEEVKEYIKKLTPKIVYHPNFKEVLPSVISKDKIDNKNIMVERLQKYLKCDFKEIFQNTNKSERATIIENLSRELDEEFSKIFKQNKTKLMFNIDGDELSIRVKDLSVENNYESNSIVLNERSEGFQWYLNFFITLKSENVDKNCVILIDEPGVFLHPTAQKEMLEFIEKQSQKYQIIFTSHSPYLINIDKQEKIRIVEKIEVSENRKVNETKVYEKIHSISNSDSLKPIIDAIGYNIPDINLNFKKILICEGPSDCYYIKLLCKVKDINLNKFNITFAGSADKMENLGKMYLGLGFEKIYYLIDTDKKGEQIYNKLFQSGVDLENILFLNEINIKMSRGKYVFNGKSLSIEDIFNKEFFLSKMQEFSNINKEKYDSLNKYNKNSIIIKEYEDSIKSDNNKTTIKWLLSKEVFNSDIGENKNIFIEEIKELVSKLRHISE